MLKKIVNRLLRLDYCELKEKLQLLVDNSFTSILLKSIEI